jgi:D-alanyl-D-alanine carboxypeptidase
MANFYQDVIVNDPRFDSVNRIDDINLLEPVTRQAVQSIITDANAQGTPVMVYETYRSQERQTQLYNQGVTQLKTVGVHHFGLACDIVKNVGGQPNWDSDFSFLGVLAKKYDLIWGGDWGHPGVQPGFVDNDHVQRCAVADQPALFDLTWYPDAAYDPYSSIADEEEEEDVA